MKKTIIVTGGAGFIGSNFVYHMLGKYPEYRIVCVDCLTYAGNLSTLKAALENPNFKFCKINICDREAIYKLFEEEHPDIVVNFAAESHVDRSIENPEIFLDTNIKGTAVMMDACRKYGIQRYHQVSTDEVVIFRWIDQICFLQRKHQSTQVHHIHLQKLGLIYWYWLIIEHMVCQLQLAVALIIMVHTIFRKN